MREGSETWNWEGGTGERTLKESNRLERRGQNTKEQESYRRHKCRAAKRRKSANTKKTGGGGAIYEGKV